MSDDKGKVGEDRKLISLKEDYERRDWAKSLGVTETQLMEAVETVGHSVEDVRRYLQSKK